MKALKTVMLSMLGIMGLQANAQTDLTTLTFVDKAGNVVADGSTLTVSEFENGQISTGLFVKNNTSDEAGALCYVNVEQMDNGAVSCCFPSNCVEQKSVGDLKTVPGGIEGEESVDFQTEWKPATYGTCTSTFQLYVQEVTMVYNPILKMDLPDYNTFKAYGPTIKVNFIYSDPASVDGVSNDNAAKAVAFYNMNGQQISAPLQNGVTMVKYNNGKTIKMIQK